MSAEANQLGMRAYIVFDKVPAGHVTHHVECQRNAPHIRAGETIVVDSSDREPIHGEVFLFQYSSGPRGVSQTMIRRHREVLQDDGTRAEEDLWWTCPLNRPQAGETIDDWIKARRQLYLSDGPCRAEVLRKKIVGRVVGIYLKAQVTA